MAKRPIKEREDFSHAAVRVVEAITGVHLKPKAAATKPSAKKRIKRRATSHRSRARR
jgi:hypothetical protein